METDICLCSDVKSAHDGICLAIKPYEIGKEVLCGCVGFRLDRKATWNADKGKKPALSRLLIYGCRKCGRTDVPLERLEKGNYYPQAHDCKGERPTLLEIK